MADLKFEEIKTLMNKILTGKIKADDKINRYSITPQADDYGWGDAIEEGRGYGIPIASFGDTSDKIVLHPGHLGYNFNYFWGKGSWGSGDCFYDIDYEKKLQANNELASVGQYLIKMGYKVNVCSPSGSEKGYLSTELMEIEDIENNDNDFVLFVYGLTIEKLELIVDSLNKS